MGAGRETLPRLIRTPLASEDESLLSLSLACQHPRGSQPSLSLLMGVYSILEGGGPCGDGWNLASNLEGLTV